MNIKPIHTEEDHAMALARLDEIFNAEPGSPEHDEADILITLVEVYESKNTDTSLPDPIEAIRFEMDQRGLTEGDMVPFLGQRSRVSEVLNKKRGLSINMIRRLHKGLKIPLECLFNEPEEEHVAA